MGYPWNIIKEPEMFHRAFFKQCLKENKPFILGKKKEEQTTLKDSEIKWGQVFCLHLETKVIYAQRYLKGMSKPWSYLEEKGSRNTEEYLQVLWCGGHVAVIKNQ